MNREILFRGKRKDNGEWVKERVGGQEIAKDSAFGLSAIKTCHIYNLIVELIKEVEGQ